jgi:hypothetical protein
MGGPSSKKRMLTVAVAIVMLASTLLAALPGSLASEGVPPTTPAGVDKDTVRASVLKGLGWLATQQAADGGWSTTAGITGLALVAYEAAGFDYNNQTVRRGLDYLRSFYNASSGQSYNEFYFYEQSISLMAFCGAGDPQDAAKIPKMQSYLASLQYTQAELNESTQVYLGGMIGSGGAPDLSTGHFDVLGLQESILLYPELALPESFWDGIVTYAMRCQNWPDVNPLAWAHNASHGSYMDGGFCYNHARGRTAAGNDAMESYGSITAAGLYMYLVSGHGFQNAETAAASAWTNREYNLLVNPRMLGRGIYSYLWEVARAMAMSPQDRIVDNSSKVHDWRTDIAYHHMTIQRADGGWNGNPVNGWREEESVLTTIYCLMALEAAYLLAPNPSFELQVTGASSAKFIGPDGDALITDSTKGLTVTSDKLTCTDSETFRKLWVDISGASGATATVTAKGTWGSGTRRTSQTSTTVRLGGKGAEVFSGTGGFAGPFGIVLLPYPDGPAVTITNRGPLELVRGETTIVKLTVEETTGVSNVTALDIFALLPKGATVDVNRQMSNLTKGGKLTVEVSIFVPANATKGAAGRIVATSNNAPAAVLEVEYVDETAEEGAPPLYWVLILVLFIVVMALIALPAVGRRRAKGGGDKPQG